MRALVVGSGAGGASAARELAGRGVEVVVLEAGGPLRPFPRIVRLAEPLRRAGLLGTVRTLRHLFPAMDLAPSRQGVLVARGLAAGGSTGLSCGNWVRAERGLAEIGLDLRLEFEELEGLIPSRPFPRERWRPTTDRMFAAAQAMGLEPRPTPKAVDPVYCEGCGLCELGCARGARWDSRGFLADVRRSGGEIRLGARVTRVLLEGGRACGVAVEGSSKEVRADAVILAAGGVGTAQILRASGLPVADRLWIDVVLTLGGVSRRARQLDEPPMVWYADRERYILSPYFDLLSHMYHGPWRSVSVRDRVGVMVKLADAANGSVGADGRVEKALTLHDQAVLTEGISLVQEIMERSDVNGPFVEGVVHGGHLGGTVPLSAEDVASMHPSGLPERLWVADLSLVPRSQGLPTMLIAAAIALRVARRAAAELGAKAGPD